MLSFSLSLYSLLSPSFYLLRVRFVFFSLPRLYAYLNDVRLRFALLIHRHTHHHHTYSIFGLNTLNHLGFSCIFHLLCSSSFPFLFFPSSAFCFFVEFSLLF
uniref:Putative secreted protein n=1 Tax=Anopheles marajoara TaxID=58244 RepID=A0A2M4C9M3_9DIPT